MSFPVNFIAAIATNDFKFGRWLEIEGLPFAVGTFSAQSSFFSGRGTADRFLGIAQSLRDKPKTLDQTLDVLNGGAETTGQVEFEILDVPALNLSASGDVDGSPIQWTGQGLNNGIVLSSAITAAATTIPFLGTASGFSAGGYLYIGTEAIQIGSVGASSFTGCTRARFKSRAQAFPVGIRINNRPVVMANRRCWFYHNAVLAGQTLTSEGTATSNQLLRFAGIVRNLRFKDGEWGTFLLPAQTIDQEINRDAFRSFRNFKLQGTSIADAAGKNGFHQAPGLPGYSAFSGVNNADLNNIPTTRAFETGEDYLIKIDDEYFLGQIIDGIGGTQSFRMSQRGVFNSPIVSHKEGALCTECIVVSKYDTIHNFFQASQFASVATTDSPLEADHPLLILLQLLLSTGDGTNYAGGSARNYDVLPVEWGMQIPYNRIDIAGIEAAAAEEPMLRWGGVFTQPMNFVSLMRQMLGFAGYYYFSDRQDLLKIRRCRPPLPDVSLRTIQDSTRTRKFVTGWDGNYGGAVREVEFSHNYNIRDGRYEAITVFITASDLYAKGLGKRLKYETNLVYTGASSVPGAPPMYPFDVDQWLLTRRDFYKLRYGKPPAIVTERVDIAQIDITIGDIVTVSHDQLPNATLGTRGMEEIGEIIGHQIDDVSNTIGLRILMTGYQLGSYRFIAPSMEIESVLSQNAGGAVWLMKENSFSAPTGPQGTAQTDGQVEGSGEGAIIDMFADSSTLPITVWSPDFATKYEHTADFTSYSYNTATRELTVVWGGAPGVPPVAGWFVTWQLYDALWKKTAPGDDKNVNDLYAFAADSTDLLGATHDDPAHVFFPT